jgi:hypothetical protein
VYVDQIRRTVDSSVGCPVPPTVAKAMEESVDAAAAAAAGLLQ